MTDRTKRVVTLVALLAASAAAAAIGGVATAGSVATWYPTLIKPSFNPPDWIFGPVWTILYLMMALAAWRIWCIDHPDRSRALAAYGVQLMLNLAWSLIFFGMQRPDLALAEIVLLVAIVALTARWFWTIDRLAGLLLIPYLLWISFATVLNAAIWRLN